MLSSKKSSMGASVAFVGALVAAAVCLLAVMAAVGTEPAEAQPRPGGPDNPLTYVTEDSPSNAGSTSGKAVAKCPSGHRVISGGFDVRDRLGTPWTIYESRPSGIGPNGRGEPSDAWVVVATTIERNPKPFTAYAVCAPESLVPPGSIDYPNRTEPVPPGQVKEITPDCQPSYKAIGGGFAKHGPLFLVRSQPNPGNGFRSWIVVASVLPNYNGNLSAYSVCVREELVRSLQFFQGEAKDRTAINANTERCPQGTYLLGGGGGTNERNAPYVDWSHMRPGVGAQANPPSDWSTGAIKREIRGAPGEITVNAHAMCGRLDPDVPNNPLEYVSQSFHGRSGTLDRRTECPRGYRPIGGGFDQHLDRFSFGERQYVNVIGSRPYLASETLNAYRDGWLATWTGGNSREIDFTTYAVCAPESLVRDISYRSTEVSVPGKSISDVVPKCLPRERAIGGGWSTDSSLVELIRSQPNLGDLHHSWLITAHNSQSRNTSATMRGYAVCVPEELISELTFTRANKNQFSNPINVSSSRCPAGTYLLGGGAGVPNSSDGDVRWSHIRPDTGNQSWGVGAYNMQLVSSLDVYTYAMCGRLVGPQAGGAGDDRTTNDNDGNKKDKKKHKKKQGKHGGVKAGKGYAKVGGVKAKGGHARVGVIGASL